MVLKILMICILMEFAEVKILKAIVIVNVMTKQNKHH